MQANKKALREAAKILIAMPADKETTAKLKTYRLASCDCTYAMALVAAQFRNALQGDTRAFTAIRDIIGEKPKDNDLEELEQDNKVVINIIPANEAETERYK